MPEERGRRPTTGTGRVNALMGIRDQYSLSPGNGGSVFLTVSARLSRPAWALG